MKSLKVCLLGPSFSGKTSLVNYLHDIPYNDNNDATIGVAYSCVKIENARLHLWDTAGQERYAPLLSMYYRNADICICMFDASNHSSLIELEKLIPKLSPDTKIIVLGNKIDLLNNTIEYNTTLEPIYISIKEKKGLDAFTKQLRTHIQSIPFKPEDINEGIQSSYSCCY